MTGLPNNGLHQTRARGVAFAFRRRPVIEGALAGEAGCCAGSRGGHRRTTLGSFLFAVAVSTSAQTPSPLPPVRISDDVCAVMLRIDARVVDARQKPVEGARVFIRRNGTAGNDLHLLGMSDAKGQLTKLACYQSSTEYRESPPSGSVSIEFVVNGWHYADVVARHQVSAQRLLRDGLLPSQSSPEIVPRKDVKTGAAYRLKIQVVLRGEA